ncbi:iron chelate uptake ABC transporter family permease subunit [Arsenicicoccus piscis]|uniref:Iron-enterobactin transporter permease n=1 Tax=Arsenicicoccus piscis TaxID=673954 RepID=A0ABQ6HLI4_9MICO|nr:iron chelate uptake ABC transporter family permease subunit [Arsenicicoccus piscis]MCH8626777.1 iron chelate uptake ABC transporter family permease subunit [Arsenicicoccus piscis]MCH8628726.1 iron chelate uptake ABC transporter family permease subunit [Arsenicicoccus piscis]GMA19331.1 iron-enterobactin transporter permease [Arsenicicoccus piscis]
MTARRPVLAVAGLVLTLVVVASATLAAGRLGIAPGRQLDALWDLARTGDGPFVLKRLRGPRLATGIGAGAALGLAGALLQRTSGNPLVTPDVIGITAGAGAGLSLSLLVPSLPAGVGAVLGAALAALIVHRSTGVGFRDPAAVIVAGIGVAALATALTQCVMISVRREEAEALGAALTGSLAARTWTQAGTVALAVLVLGAVASTLRGRLRLLELGDEAAHALGGAPGPTRALATAVSIALTAAAVSVAGPIMFAALTAPHLARWVTGRVPLLTAALVGALVVAAADLAVQQVPAVQQLPVGVLTAAIGGVFLGALLLQQWRTGRA